MTAFSLTGAAATLAVSNTPLFLLRRLQSDPVTLEIADHLSGEAILSQTKELLSRKPASLEEEVFPYALLVALARLAEKTHLRSAAELPSPYHPWFRYIARVLEDTYVPSAYSKFTGNVRAEGSDNFRSDASSVVNVLSKAQ